MSKLDLEKAEEPEIKLSHQLDHRKSKRIPEKTFTSASLTMLNPLTVWITTNCGKFFKRWEIPDHITCLLRNLYGGQEATVRTWHGTTDWFKIEEGICQGCILSPYIYNLYAEHIMWNARLDEAQDGIEMAGRNIVTSYMKMTPSLWQRAKKN